MNFTCGHRPGGGTYCVECRPDLVGSVFPVPFISHERQPCPDCLALVKMLRSCIDEATDDGLESKLDAFIRERTTP